LPITWAVKPSERTLVVGQGLLLGGSAVGAIVLSQPSDWEPLTLFWLLLAVSVVSEAYRLETRNLHISATFLAVVLPRCWEPRRCSSTR
jgi:uncharacterized membrane protein